MNNSSNKTIDLSICSNRNSDMEQFSNKIIKQGHSFMIVIPKKVRTKLDLCVGDRPIILISKDGKNENDINSSNKTYNKSDVE